jgi:mono/diheme cytochrome c family protein
VVLVLAIGAVGWLGLRPHGPTDFAGGARVELADYRGGDPTGAPPSIAGTDMVARGEYLTRAADCVACHTAPGGKPFAGGMAFPLPFGSLYSTNITPDKDTGIGAWSDEDFVKALHEGVGRETVNDAAAVNATQAILQGARLRTAHGEVFMSAFGTAYSDAEIAAVLNYVTGRFGANTSAIKPDEVAKRRQGR